MAILLLILPNDKLWILLLIFQVFWLPLPQWVHPCLLGTLAAVECLRFCLARRRCPKEARRP